MSTDEFLIEFPVNDKNNIFEDIAVEELDKLNADGYKEGLGVLLKYVQIYY